MICPQLERRGQADATGLGGRLLSFPPHSAVGVSGRRGTRTTSTPTAASGSPEQSKRFLRFYTIITCVGGGVTPPTLATPVTFNPGLRCDTYVDSCNNTNWTVYTEVPYTAGPLYWDPSISNAFTRCDEYTFYGKVDGTPSDPLCSKVTATVGPGNPGTPFTVWVVQAELEAVDYWSDFTPFYNYNTDFAGDGTTTFSRPVWQRSPATNNPVVQPQGQAVELNVTINVCPYGLAFELIGVSSVPGLCFTNTDVIAAGGNQDVRVTASVPLANSVDVVIGSIDWYALIGGPAWNSPTQMCFLNTSGPHTNYVTWANPFASTATFKRINRACNIAQGAASITAAAEKFRDAISVSPGHGDGVHMVHNETNSWAFLDSGQPGDCITLADLACTGLAVIGVSAAPAKSWPTADGSGFPGAPATVTSSTCTAPTVAYFTYNNQQFTALLEYPYNHYEGFFTVSDPYIKAYTVYPAAGSFTNQNYYYLQVLKRVATDQLWAWFPQQTNNNVIVTNDLPVPGAAHIPVPEIPAQ